jgi:hypothetical protein
MESALMFAQFPFMTWLMYLGTRSLTAKLTQLEKKIAYNA